jgi:hypothetical protein
VIAFYLFKLLQNYGVASVGVSDGNGVRVAVDVRGIDVGVTVSVGGMDVSVGGAEVGGTSVGGTGVGVRVGSGVGVGRLRLSKTRLSAWKLSPFIK